MRKVKKAVIPAAGLGTRFLPATKTVPKEMLPIVDKPILLFIVEEAVAAGIEDIILIAGRHKNAIEDFFDVSYELEDRLSKDGKSDWLKSLKHIQSLANVISIRQKQALGLGHAVHCGKPIVGSEPFAVLLGDEIMDSKPGAGTVTEGLAASYGQTGISTVAMMNVADSEVSKYGVVEGEPEIVNGLHRMRVKNLIEKPSPQQTQSRWAMPGRYVFDSAIFSYLENTKPGRGGEIQLTDAMIELAKKEGLFASEFAATRFDAGDKFGFLQANIEFALRNPEIEPRLSAYIKEMAKL